MVDRVERILLALMSAEGFLTSNELSNNVGVSSRTVKSAMRQVNDLLQKHGARLDARRNRGYSIIVDDQKMYQQLKDQIQLRSYHIAMAGYDNTMRTLHICRKLVASSEGAKIDEICDELAISRSAIRKPLRKAIAYCKTFHLCVQSAPGQGIQVYGEEHMLRLAMVEFFEIHFHTYKPEDTAEEYARWIRCSYEERQDIRHIFLKVLRDSNFILRDTDTQRVAVYLLIARNRIAAGFPIFLSETWISEIMQTPLYALSETIFMELDKHFDGYNVSQQERAFLAIWLFVLQDAHSIDELELGPLTYSQIQNVYEATCNLFQKTTHLDLRLLPKSGSLLTKVVFHILAAQHYGMDGKKRIDSRSERWSFRSPLIVYLADSFINSLAQTIGATASLAQIAYVASAFCAILDEIEIPVKPLNLLLINESSVLFSGAMRDDLMRYFGNLINSITECQLYEIRGMNMNDYDAVITNIGRAGYNYKLPHYWLSLIDGLGGFIDIYNHLLISAYDVASLLPDSSCIYAVNQVSPDSLGGLLGFLAMRFIDCPAIMQMLKCIQAEERADAATYQVARGNGCLFLIAPTEENELIELYKFSRAIQWHGQHIAYAILCILDFSQGIARLRVLERFLYELMNNGDKLEQFIDDPQKFTKKIMDESLKITLHEEAK